MESFALIDQPSQEEVNFWKKKSYSQNKFDGKNKFLKFDLKFLFYTPKKL